MIGYADSSFLVSLYSADINTDAALEQVEREHPLLIYSSIAALETVNAVNQRVFRKQFSAAMRDSVLAAVQADIERRVLIARDVPDSAFALAIRLSSKWIPRYGARASDLLHVAVALEASIDRFYTFDKRQLQIARAEGLKA